jgi:hypothetical protein
MQAHPLRSTSDRDMRRVGVGLSLIAALSAIDLVLYVAI